ncbi:MAG: carbohydrate kinase family protein [Lacipirellulaceae bacterium]
MDESKSIDCIVCGSCTVDILVRPFQLDQPVIGGRLYEVDPLRVETGGIVSNSGATFARLGLKTEAFTLIGDDEFGTIIRDRFQTFGVGTQGLSVHCREATSASVVMVDPSGERSFAHCVGAPRELDLAWFESHMSFFKQSRAVMLGYFSLMPKLEPDLPQVLGMLRQAGCLTILESAGSGGSLDDLAPSLAEVDIYLPSEEEARHQTGTDQPGEMIELFRARGARGTVGIKCGTQGSVISPVPGEVLTIDCIEAPGAVVDTTGAGDAFLAGYVAGILKELSPSHAGRLAAAAGACCVTGLGASAGLRDYQETAQLAGL